MSIVLSPQELCQRCGAMVVEDADPVLHPEAGARHMFRCINGHTIMGEPIRFTIEEAGRKQDGRKTRQSHIAQWAVCARCEIVEVPERGQLCGMCRPRGGRHERGTVAEATSRAKRRCPRCKGPKETAASKTCVKCRDTRGPRTKRAL